MPESNQHSELGGGQMVPDVLLDQPSPLGPTYRELAAALHERDDLRQLASPTAMTVIAEKVDAELQVLRLQEQLEVLREAVSKARAVSESYDRGVTEVYGAFIGMRAALAEVSYPASEPGTSWGFDLVRSRDGHRVTVTVPMAEYSDRGAALRHVWSEFDPGVWWVEEDKTLKTYPESVSNQESRGE